ncbi:MAG TPA: sigma 54-interacting transcriptional regulator [Candidatus Desulfobacillus sp.]|nr:sigma 54-interacting transcriptional regulator [Candidatus Desulfobacillus sp.]
MSEAQAPILLVDDDRDLLQLISLRLASAGHAVLTAESGEEALSRLALARPSLVITDLRMEGMDGLALFERIHALMPTLPVIILTAHGTVPDAVSAMQKGVFSFLTKPFEGKELLAQVAQALKVSGGAAAAGAGQEWRAAIVTRSQRMEELLRQARLVAASEASVLIFGASGSGKELLAKAIHMASARASGPFIAVNCAAIPENLLESELFGHARGAFSGAVQAHRGLFQAAKGGTLFLDEIGDMPLGLQAKLLRALQDRSVRPVGSTETVPVDVRILSATHRDLGEAIAAGDFRSDLYYRLNVVALSLPALAERREDIPLLCAHFIEQLTDRYGKPMPAFAPEAMELLVNAAWPGNVRQLLNVVEQTVALATSPLVPASLVQQALRDDSAASLSLDEARRAFEHDYLVRLLRTTEGNVAQAARMAQRNRTEFYKLLQRHNLSPAQFKAEKA